jgi:hypothetical protein
MKRNIVFSAAFLIAGLLTCEFNIGGNAGVVSSAQAQGDDVATAGQIEGTWLVTVTPPAGGPPAYFSTASFGRGGTLITAPDPSIEPGVTSTGQGSWEKTGRRQFTSTHIAFIYGAGGTIVGTIKINSTYRLTDSDTFEGFGQLQICDSTGENCFFPGPPGVPPPCANLHGERLKATGTTCSF